MKRQLMAAVLVVLLAGDVAAGDLYEVRVGSPEEAAAARNAGVQPVVRVEGGYLVLVEPERVGALLGSGLDVRLVEAGIEWAELAIDIRRDGSNVGKYPVVYEEGELRLYRVEPELISEAKEPTGLAPVLTQQMRIEYREPVELPVVKDAHLMMDLDSLVAWVQQDSVQSYLERLQAFNGRVAGTDSNAVARDWLAGKFAEFGYDSVVIDTFRPSLGGVLTPCHNVIAVKPGVYADRHEIIVGAHRDAGSGSPGADDNGSGTAGVLEIARVLANVETQATIKFILFDAEEWGLYGSWHYAGQAANRGDSIIVMLNMDMIGHYENTTSGRAMYMNDSAFAQVWADHGATREGVNITTTEVIPGSGGSDHYPFGQLGYDAVFVQEYIFSTVYHQPTDSTTYISFDYLTRMIKATAATAYYVDQTYPFSPAVVIQAAGEPPVQVFPNRPDTFAVSVAGYTGGQVAPGSERLYYSLDGGSYAWAPLTPVGGEQYLAIFPGLPFDSRVGYYLAAEELGGAAFRWPAADLQAAVAATATTLLEDDFNEYLGWSTLIEDATEGFWERRIPVRSSYISPSVDYDGSGWCYLTGWNSGVDVDAGTVVLQTPVFRVTGTDEMLIEYARWYYGTPYSDRFRIRISNDSGLTWYTAQVFQSAQDSDGRWRSDRLWVGDVFSSPNKVRVRFEVSDLGGDSRVEGALDAVRVTVFDNGEALHALVDSLPSWTTGRPYSQQLMHEGGYGTVRWREVSGQLPGLGLSLTESGMLEGMPSVSGTYPLVVVAADEIGREDTAAVLLVLNPPVMVTTTEVPAGKVGEAYQTVLAATGGTAPLVWDESEEVLAGFGLSLSAAGMVSGTPTHSGTLVFTPRVTDVAGDTAAVELPLYVAPDFICGDVDGNEVGPNVADLTYFVSYLFRGGPGPMKAGAADVTGDGTVAVGDLTRLIDFLFRGGGPLNCL